jgi:hypothetical protein
MARPRDYGRGAGNHKINVPRREFCAVVRFRVSRTAYPERGTSFLNMSLRSLLFKNRDRMTVDLL